MNMLSLPSVVTFSDGSTITYYYDAEGNKVRVIYSITGKTSLQRNYSNGVIYDNGSQQCLLPRGATLPFKRTTSIIIT